MKNLPLSWSRMTPYSRAGYLVNAHLAPDFRTACQMVNKMRVAATPKPRPTTRRGKAVNVAEGAWYQSGGYA